MNKKPTVLVACEYSGRVRDAFRAAGCSAWSCDLLPAEGDQTYHFQADMFEVVADGGWDLVLAFPPCTDLAVSGARWFKEKQTDGRQQASLEFALKVLNLDVPRLAVENPVGILSTHFRKPDQIIQPWQFGHGETKATCLWLKGLPKLTPTNIVEGREQRVWKMPPGPDRWKERSRTFEGIATAMAQQWAPALFEGTITTSGVN